MNAVDTRQPLRVLMLADDKPGHYHQSEGIVEALQRLGPVACRRLHVQRRQLVPRAVLRAIRRRSASSEYILSLGYGLSRAQISSPDLIVSSGGETMFANHAASAVSGARNIFLGPVDENLRDGFNLTISSHDKGPETTNHVCTLQPSAIDPERLARPSLIPTFDRARPPKTCALLLGGDTRDIRYSVSDWARLAAFLRITHDTWGTRWVVSSSRRTSREALSTLASVLHDKAVVRHFLDYRMVGPSSLPSVLRLAEVVVVTADSSAMLSEAVAGRFPVIAVAASDHRLDPAETQYRNYLSEQDWTRTIPIGTLTPDAFLHDLATLAPRTDNHLDTIAQILSERLPDLVASA